MPSGRFLVASAGHTSTQGASLHWLQRTGMVESSCPGTSVSQAIRRGQVMPRGRKCSIRQAAIQAWQRVHFARLITIPHLIAGPPPYARFLSRINYRGNLKDPWDRTSKRVDLLISTIHYTGKANLRSEEHTSELQSRLH